MKLGSVVVAALAAATWPWVGVAAGAARATIAKEGAPGTEEAIRAVFPALVRIHVVASAFREGREVREEGSGSGVIFSPEGYVLTNHHVAGRARRLTCTLSDRREIDAVLLGSDPLADIAVLKLDPTFAPYPAATFGDSSTLKVGDPVLAMGSPLSISQSVTLGIVSNTAMAFPSMFWPQTFRLDGEEVGSLVQWIGHDAQIFPGNSGGPLVNLSGEVVGINEISLGLAGAIPATLALGVAEELVRHGEVRRSWLGLDVQPMLRGAKGHGALVSGVVPGSPAEKAGLLPGDLLTSLGGEPVDVHYAEELPAFNRRVLQAPLGSAVALTYERDGRLERATATTIERGVANGEEVELRSLGLTVRDLSLLAARERRREPHSGVLVTGIRAGAPAAEAKTALRVGDVLVTVEGAKVRTNAELAREVARATKGKPRSYLLVGFERQGQSFLTVLRVSQGEEGDRSVEARKAYLPVAVQVLTPDLAEALRMKGKTGVRVTQVYPGTSAERAGILVGDVFTKVDDLAITTSRPEDLDVFWAMIRAYPLSSKVKLTLFRAGSMSTLEVLLAESPPSVRELREYRDLQFEFGARDLTTQDRVQSMLDMRQAGALITRVETGGFAALAHLSVGDLVLAVDGVHVEDADQLRAEMDRVAARRPQRVVLFVRRGVQTLFLEMEPAWPAQAVSP